MRPLDVGKLSRRESRRNWRTVRDHGRALRYQQRCMAPLLALVCLELAGPRVTVIAGVEGGNELAHSGKSAMSRKLFQII